MNKKEKEKLERELQYIQNEAEWILDSIRKLRRGLLKKGIVYDLKGLDKKRKIIQSQEVTFSIDGLQPKQLQKEVIKIG